MHELPCNLPNDLRLKIFIPTAFSPLGGLGAHTRKKKTQNLRILRNIRKIPKFQRLKILGY